MKRKVIFMLMLLLLLLVSLGCAKDKEVYIGEWVFTKEIRIKNLPGMSVEDIASFIGTQVVYDEDYVRLSGDLFKDSYYDNLLKDPFYKKETLTPEDLYVEKVRFSDLGIDQGTVTAVEIFIAKDKEDWCNPGGWFIIKNIDTLVTFWDGTYFELKRKK